jgi:O-antigen/teichoic acid export membrane protein
MAKRSGAVLRNTLILVGGQLAGVPLSVALNAAMGRYLGATDFGYIYLAVTLTGFGFLLVEWGHGSVIAAAVARDTARAGSLVGTSLLWRLSSSLLVSVVLWLLSIILGYTSAFRWVLLFQLLTAVLAAVRNTYLDAVRGFERLEFSAYAQLATQLLSVALIIPGLALGGQLTTVLLLQVACNLLVTIAVWRVWRSIGRQPLAFDRSSLKELFGHGSSFLIFGFAMALQPNVDAIFLSKLTSPTVLGWQAAAQRLQGLIIMPVAALGSALYPTLSRLYVEDRAEYNATVGRSLQGTALLAIPAALGCALYRAVGVRMFGRASFEHVEQNLLVLSSLVFLLYFSMPVGVAILAAGRQRPFAMVQCLCIVVSVALDPLLIPWFDSHYGNGGLGVCVANAVSEVLVLGAAMPLLPRGIGIRALAKSIGKGLVAAAAMAGVAFALGGITPYVAAPIAGLTYFGCLWLIGGIEPAHIEAVRGLVARKLARRQQA